MTAPASRPPVPAPPVGPVDVAALQRLLDGDQHETRTRLRALLSRPEFAFRYGLAKEAYREQVLGWLRRVAEEGFGAAAYPVAYGGDGDVLRFFAAFETLATHDHSLCVKFGVQFGLFGGSIYLLGTERHHARYLRDVGSLRLPGCFAMTEIGHGSNVRDIGTTATYDAAAREFVVHTPTPDATKEWIGNAAAHGRLATVFAQLVVGGTNHGVHAILVPLRDEQGHALPGVTIRDSGEKAGLNGVDNGQIAFDQVRVPRENLLNRFADVTPEGVYESPISNPSKRFFTMLSTLVGGRITVAGSAISAAKTGLAIAVRYSARRRQFGPQGGAEVPLLEYRTHQRRLFLPLAGVYAYHFALESLGRRFAATEGSGDREIESLAAGLKALATWQCRDALQAARECCGGQGYRLENRIAQLRADSDITVTFEGDNTVLLQLVAKGLLTGYREHLGGLGFAGLVRYVAQSTSLRLQRRNAVVSRLTDEAHLRDARFQLGALVYREERMLRAAARRIKGRMDDGMDGFEALLAVQDHLVALATAYVERVAAEAFHAAVARAAPELRPPLALLADLFALGLLERAEGWYLGSGLIEPVKSKAIRELVNQLCAAVRPHAVSLVDAFGIPDAILAAPIATSGS